MPFFDHINGGPTVPEAVRAMAPWLEAAANPQVAHATGRRAHMALEAARAQVAGLIGANPAQVVFGATGTEVNNLSVKGYLKANRRKGRHVLLSAVEHPSVERACRRMAEDGWRPEALPVDAAGRVAPEAVERALTDETALVCLQLANPEVGTVQPVAEVAALARAGGAAVLVDAVFAAGRMTVDVAALGADLITLSGPGIWGPAGAAALYVRRGVRIQPEVDGGVEEGGRRGGQVNVAAVVGMGAAAERLSKGLEAHLGHLEGLAGALRERVAALPGVRLTGAAPGEGAGRAAGHVSLLVPGADGESFLALLDRHGVAASSGSFCGAKAMKASPVLTAMGYPPEAALAGVVLSLGPQNTAAEVDQCTRALRECIVGIEGVLKGGAGPGRPA
jgi:cysteine desulfurase